ncbi:Uncharacterized protein PECH_000886 [Penicillium ucsense]|uniref:Uncharacterized protein n=1 Tax=Penicillium ucsense TaxID=2839758 RepID=A0A8J8WGR1_9EURO|nr:Uncharacterized protein PECM_000646 [Penicillium ucsense]KAF7733277.1 Uncharacterized protein PECH_000886 [Penicillium ucsense]
MGQRHNRRRTRPRSSKQKHLDRGLLGSFYHSVSDPSPVLPASSWRAQSPSHNPHSAAAHNSPVSICSLPGSPHLLNPAPIWHSGLTAWPIHEEAPQQGPLGSGIEARQYRLFGGEPGDDLNLCYRMLEYFDGLDYIDPLRCNTMGD